MKKILLIIFALLLTGCASWNWTATPTYYPDYYYYGVPSYYYYDYRMPYYNAHYFWIDRLYTPYYYKYTNTYVYTPAGAVKTGTKIEVKPNKRTITVPKNYPTRRNNVSTPTKRTTPTNSNNVYTPSRNKTTRTTPTRTKVNRTTPTRTKVNRTTPTRKAAPKTTPTRKRKNDRKQ